MSDTASGTGFYAVRKANREVPAATSSVRPQTRALGLSTNPAEELRQRDFASPSRNELSRQPLFRAEALSAKRHDAFGPIHLPTSTSFLILTTFFSAAALALIVFVFVGTYTKKARVYGYLAPQQGLIKVYTPQGGFVVRRLVQEGSRVKKGDVLFTISSERKSARGETALAIIHQLLTRGRSLREQIVRLKSIYRDQVASVKERISLFNAEVPQLEYEIQQQTIQVDLASRMVKRYEQLVKQNIVAEIALEERQRIHADQTQRLSELRRRLLATQRDLETSRYELMTLPMKQENENEALRRDIADIEAQIAEREAQLGIDAIAPLDGTVTVLVADIGSAVTTSNPLLSLVPEGNQLQAYLYASSRAIGFIRPDAKVQIRYLSFPYQKFGMHEGVITAVSRTAVQPNELPFPQDTPTQGPLYLITVTLQNQYVTAYGQRMPLQAGMQVEADILLDERPIYEWLLEPLYSIKGKM